VHGEAIHLRAHAKLAREIGIADDHIFVVDNGDTLEMRNHKVRRAAPVDSGVVYVDGLSVTDADPVVLRDRQKLSKDGIVTVVVTVSLRSHRVRDIEIYSRGVSFSGDEELNRDATDVVRQRVEKSADADMGVDQIRKGVRNGLSNFLWSRTHTRPMVIPVVMEV
jgi:ribonuclease J